MTKSQSKFQTAHQPPVHQFISICRVKPCLAANPYPLFASREQSANFILRCIGLDMCQPCNATCWFSCISSPHLAKKSRNVLSFTDGVDTAGKCASPERSNKCSLGPHQLCFVTSAGLQNQHLIRTVGRGS